MDFSKTDREEGEGAERELGGGLETGDEVSGHSGMDFRAVGWMETDRREAEGRKKGPGLEEEVGGRREGAEEIGSREGEGRTREPAEE
jgi:hypothetical protein